jgi:hypothetical protein
VCRSGLGSVIGEEMETGARLFFGLFGQLAFPDEPTECSDCALDPRSPPHGYVAVFCKRRCGGRGRLPNDQR